MIDYNAETEKEVQNLLNAGMIICSPDDIKQLVGAIGYTVRHDFNYVNTINDVSYNAKSVKLIDAAGYSFSNVDSVNRENLKELQKIRLNYFVYHNNRIWEL